MGGHGNGGYHQPGPYKCHGNGRETQWFMHWTAPALHAGPIPSCPASATAWKEREKGYC